MRKVAALALRQRRQYRKQQQQRRAAAADEEQGDVQQKEEETSGSLRVFDLILAADVVYEDDAIGPLVATVLVYSISQNKL